MLPAGPYRPPHSSTWTEEELWLRLDCALEEALRDPVTAFSLAWSVVVDAADFPDVRRATEAFLTVLEAG